MLVAANLVAYCGKDVCLGQDLLHLSQHLRHQLPPHLLRVDLFRDGSMAQHAGQWAASYPRKSRHTPLAALSAIINTQTATRRSLFSVCSSLICRRDHRSQYREHHKSHHSKKWRKAGQWLRGLTWVRLAFTRTIFFLSNQVTNGDLSADGYKVDCVLIAFGIHVRADGSIADVTAYFEGVLAAFARNSKDTLADSPVSLWHA